MLIPGSSAEDSRLYSEKMRERTVRLLYGSRVDVVYVLGTQLWTDVYR